MDANGLFSSATLWSFLLALSRVAAMWVFVPLPGGPATPAMARVVAALGWTLVMYPFWPAAPAASPGLGEILAWTASEAVLGLTAGLAVAAVAEAFTFGAQVLSLQAGFSYASTIDPTNQTDTGILALLLQLFSGWMFFAVGGERWLLSALAQSFQHVPVGAFALRPASAGAITEYIGQALGLGLRCALPVVSVLVLVDLALALAARVNAQLQLLSMAFPLKIALCLLALAAVLGSFPGIYERLVTGAGSALAGAVAAGARR
jgi:flagellar biosynthetic protein FliR